MVTVLNLFFTIIFYIINVTQHYGSEIFKPLPQGQQVYFVEIMGKVQMRCQGGS
ncbi:hypothetical protein MUG84_02815 [Paenibacillus sp. KQZ6P-2]|uniref:Uncharacterized protein n=1 Tax=Paenibacillus mangrovi TaxID=2931978 RepID=A0A9X1WKQ1_9BACL|nr:hypothetical protein [Paenibacillus mangrovi]MCJ8010674.1 hypothetical protein [Paenibacillus mangrovi]